MNYLEQLARLVGIQDVIPTTDGKEQAVSSQTKRALLRCIGINAGNEEEALASLTSLEDASWVRPLPPVIVTGRDGRGVIIPVTHKQGTGTFSWTLTLEDERTIRGNETFNDLQLIEVRTVKGQHFERRGLSITGELADGYHDLSLDFAEGTCRLILTPGACWLPEIGRDNGRLWGVAAQVYLLRSENNWGVGDYSDLRRLMELSKTQGMDIVGVNPLHAMFMDRPGDASPYSPSDRLLLNVLNIDINEMPELALSDAARALIASAAFQTNLQESREASHVDYEKTAALKIPIFRLLFDAFEAQGDPASKQDLIRFHDERRNVLDRSCLFQALRMYLSEMKPASGEGQAWPEQYRDATAGGVADFARQQAARIRFQLWLQWTADRQLSKVQEAARGMKVGLYRDLAVGSHADGAEAWTRPELYVRGVQIGAPPDQFNPAGQNWGLPPLNPEAMHRDAYAGFIDLLRANMRYGGALRIDHVMALRRLYWIPQDGETADGAYMLYPIEDLVGIIALESQRNRCMIIGEDLGGVPEGFRERMAESNILSYRVLSFERSEEAFFAPEEYPYLSLSVAGNHDLPTLSGWWSGGDIELRESLHLFPTPDGAQQANEMRARDRASLIKAFQKEGLVDSDEGIDSTKFCEAAHEFLARTRSVMTIVQLDDLAHEPEQVNVPATSDENPNWRRKLSMSLEELAQCQSFKSLASLMQSEVIESH
jgi:4-alpha-glucanotransferase